MPTSPKTVLIVDDSEVIRRMVTFALGSAGFDVVQARDGCEGLEQIDTTPDLALAFCDVNMPRMNGLEMLANLRERGRLDSLPIVMLTTEARTEVIEEARRVGAKGWLAKPFTVERLVAVARKLTGLVPSAG